MGSELLNAMQISAMGMRAQGERIRVITENVANADTAAGTPNEDPYRRQVITFKNELDRKKGINLVEVDQISEDRKTDFPVKFMPDHPGADANGNVKLPNVDMMIEIMDAREAQRSYEANLGMIEQSRSMMLRTIDMLRN
ncbi:MAG TPA: flagellar basal body rod protein FlgC [Rhodospirillaceae bacterium]|nr:flagellar basal body rod protein FlgC [Rhodospirillaceae bacterium]